MSKCVVVLYVVVGVTKDREGWGLRDRWWLNFGGGKSLLHHVGKDSNVGTDFA